MSPQNLLRSVLLGGLFCGLLPSLNLNANFGWQFLEQHRGALIVSEADLLHSLFRLTCRGRRGKIPPERPKVFGKPGRDLVSTTRQVLAEIWEASVAS